MCTPVVAQLTEALVQSYIEDGFGVSFKGLGKKWDTEEHVKDVVAQIQACQNLKFLELEGNTLGVDAAKAIGKALESKPEFEAALWRDLFTGRLKNEIPQAMKHLLAGVDVAGARLLYLDLSDNAIGPIGMTGLAPFFKSKSSFSLKVLLCNNNGMGPSGAEEFSKALVNCKGLSFDEGGETFNLKTFVCGRNRMQNKGAVEIAKFIKECTTLEEIYMPENSMYAPGLCALAEAFSANPKLRVLNLNDNTITKQGLKKLAESFQQLVHLEDLNLGDCLLKGSGALAVVNAIKDHKHLRKIVLDGNEIVKPVGVEIAQILRTCKNLVHISLSSNPFGVDGAEEIQRILTDFEKVEIEDPEDSEYEEEEEEDGADDDEEEDDENENEEGNDNDDVEDDENYEDYGEYDGEEDAVERVMRFLEEPSLEHYDAIPGGLSEYVYDLEYLNIPPYEICIQGALGIVEYYGSESPTVPERSERIFCQLMNEAFNFADAESNDFAQALLIHMGVAMSRQQEYYRDELCTPVLECLAVWLINVVNENDVNVSDSTLQYLHDSFQGVRQELSVQREQLSTLIDYVKWKRQMVRQ